jgi:hypothetical protein
MIAATLSACTPTIPAQTAAPAQHRDSDQPGPKFPTATATAIPPVKPAIEPRPLPPGVTREVLPDGTVSITIREPRCPTCSPWTF